MCLRGLLTLVTQGGEAELVSRTRESAPPGGTQRGRKNRAERNQGLGLDSHTEGYVAEESEVLVVFPFFSIFS